MTSHTEASRTSKPSSPSEYPDSRILRGYCQAEGPGNPTHLISSPRPMLRKKKRLRTNNEGPNCWETSPSTTLSLASQGHERRKWHSPKDNPPKRPKQKDQHNGPAMRAWWRSDSRRGCHLRIKYPQLRV